MPYWSRRHALQAAGGVLLTALAGCQDSEPAASFSPDDRRLSVTDFNVLKIRHTAANPMVYKRGEETTTGTSDPPRRRGQIMDFVTDESDESMGEPVFPTDVEGAGRLRSFFDETDFETQSIYLYQSPVPACYVRRLQGVFREPDGVHADFCRDLRPADEHCKTDAWAVSVFAIRLPFAGDNFSSVGGGGSSSCDRPYRETIEPDTSLVVGPDGGDGE